MELKEEISVLLSVIIKSLIFSLLFLHFSSAGDYPFIDQKVLNF